VAEELRAELVGTILAVESRVGEWVDAGATVAVIESMKMEIPVLVVEPGTVVAVAVAPGDTVQCGDVVATIQCGPAPDRPPDVSPTVIA